MWGLIVNSDPTIGLPLSQKVRLWRRNAEHRIRDLLLSVLTRCMGSGGCDPGEVVSHALKNGERILVLRTGKAIGDAVMSLVLLPEIRRLFPKARIDLLLRDQVVPLFLQGTGADRVLSFYPKFLPHLGETWKLLRHLRRAKYDVVIACDHPFKSSFTTLCLGLWTGAPCRVGFANEESRRFLSVHVTPREKVPMVQNLLRLLSPFGDVPSMAAPRLRQEEKPGRMETQAPVLIFAPNHWRKSWPLETFLRVGKALMERGAEVVLAFGPGDARAGDPMVQDWLRQSRGKACVMEPGSLVQFAQRIAGCRLFISNDCGPYHIAIATGVPCVAAFVTAEACRDFGYEKEETWVAVYHEDPRLAENRVIEAAAGLLKMGRLDSAIDGRSLG